MCPEHDSIGVSLRSRSPISDVWATCSENATTLPTESGNRSGGSNNEFLGFVPNDSEQILEPLTAPLPGPNMTLAPFGPQTPYAVSLNAGMLPSWQRSV